MMCVCLCEEKVWFEKQNRRGPVYDFQEASENQHPEEKFL